MSARRSFTSEPRTPLQRPCCYRSLAQQPTKAEAAYPLPGINQDLPDQRRQHIAAIATEHARRGGIPAAERDLYDHTEFAGNLEADYIPVNLEQAGLHIQHLSPPVLTVDNFMTAAECEQLANATQQTGTC